MNRPIRTVPLWARRPAPPKRIRVSDECFRRLARYAEMQCTTIEAVVEAMLKDVGRDGS